MMGSPRCPACLSPNVDIRQNAVEEMRNQTDKLENSEMRLKFYREVIKELAQKYIQFLNLEQKTAVLKCQAILGQWDGLTLPTQPSLTDVAKAVRYAHLKDGVAPRRRKNGARQTKNKQCTAQLRERAFFDSVKKSVRVWQEEAEAKCVLVDEIDSYIDKLHSIVSMLDSRFHHNLERFFMDGGTSRRSSSSSSSGKSGKAKRTRRGINCRRDDVAMKSNLQLKVEPILEEDENLKEDSDQVIKNKWVQTDYVDLLNSSFAEIDSDIPLFEISDYEIEDDLDALES